MTLFLLTVFVASVTGSLHCAGMCGPFALMAGICSSGCSPVAGGTAEQGALRGSSAGFRWLPMAAYHLGRMITYTIVGILAGTVGAAVDLGGSVAGFQQTATWLAGMLMVLMGLVGLLQQTGWVRGGQLPLGWIGRWIQPLMRRAVRLPPASRALGIGLLTVLMPCGWLYVFAITAAGTGSPWWGGLTMLVFWSGSVPVLVALVLGTGSLSGRIRWNLPALTAGLMIALGLYTALWRSPIAIAGKVDLPVAASMEEAARNLQGLDQHELPCCKCKQ